MGSFELPPTTIEAFQRDGAVCIRQLFSSDEVGLLERGIEHNLAFPSERAKVCLLYTSPSPRDRQKSRMPSSA